MIKITRKQIMKSTENTTEVVERSLWQEAWRRFKKSKLVMGCMYFLLALCIIAVVTIIIDLVTDKNFYDKYVISQNLSMKLVEPNFRKFIEEHNTGYIFGFDEFGRSIFLRIIWAIRNSMFLGAVAVMASTLVGGILGAIAGYYGGSIDNFIMRCMDILLAIPSILLCISIVAALGSNLPNLLISISISNIPIYARTVRAAVLSIKDGEFIEAAKAVGTSNSRIIAVHIIPNSLAPIIVQATLGLASAILSISSMSFLGLGIKPPLPEWGAMLSNARVYMRDAWHITFMPGAAIMLTILALNIVGDGLRDALDPRLKN